MKPNNTALPLSTLILAACASMGASDAGAVTQSRTWTQNAVGPCQAALPAFEGQIRKRPLALQNEGTGTAFVSCAFSAAGSSDLVSGSITRVYVYAASIDGAAHTISCTGVTGFNTDQNQFVVKTATLSADGSQSRMQWNVSDFSDSPAVFPRSTFSVSCRVDPGVGLNDTHVQFNEDVGA